MGENIGSSLIASEGVPPAEPTPSRRQNFREIVTYGILWLDAALSGGMGSGQGSIHRIPTKNRKNNPLTRNGA